MSTYVAKSTNPASDDPVQFVALDEIHAQDIATRRGLERVEAVASETIDVVATGQDMLELVRECRRRRMRTGLVPTMGALHAGHVSLVEACNEKCDFTIATIFVNPTQFAPHEDFDKYPRTLDADLRRLRTAGAHACFVPDVDEMYPPGASTMVSPPDVARRWEGEFRPTHFAGVATVVLKLFNLAPVDDAFFGRKDFQQALVVGQMVRDLKLPVQIHTCPIIREQDGLALSSRNRYLSETERQTALAVPECLASADRAWSEGQRSAAALQELMLGALRSRGVDRIDYAVVVDAETLEPREVLNRPAVALVAAHVGSTRLIDNRVFDP